jgi:hypothetical protein
MMAMTTRSSIRVKARRELDEKRWIMGEWAMVSIRRQGCPRIAIQRGSQGIGTAQG